MKISKIESYHIGTKLNQAVEVESLKIWLLQKLGEEFSINESRQLIERLPIPLQNPTQIIAKKGDTEIQINYPLRALNVVGKIPSEVYAVFEEIIGILSDRPEYEVEKIIEFFEIIAWVIASDEKKPKEVLNSSVKLNLSKLESVGGVDVAGIYLKGLGISPDEGTFDLTIAPHPLSPNKNFVIQINRKIKNIEEVRRFEELLNGIIGGIFNEF